MSSVSTERSDLRIGSVVIDCLNFPKMYEFWKEALHYVITRPPEGGWVILRDPAGKNTNVSLNEVPKRLEGRNWLHFDLYTKDQKKEIDRLIRLGAKRHLQQYESEDDFVVLEDPDGNLFCIIDLLRH